MRLRCRSSACRVSWHQPSRRPWPRASTTAPEPRPHLLRPTACVCALGASPFGVAVADSPKQPACQRHPRASRAAVWHAACCGPARVPQAARLHHGQQTPAPWLVHELHARRVGPSAVGRRLALGRPVLRGHGAGAGTRVFRLHHDRRHADGVRSLWRQRRGRVEARLAGAEARSVAAWPRSSARRRGELGVVATFSTLEYPPWMLARLCCTLDHIAGGRFGWNIVTSGEDAAAQNFGMDKLPPREQRYAMADEYVDLVCRLFNSWDPDAVVMDRETGTYADFRKVRHDRLRRKILQGARAAEHGALAARAAGIRAGGRVTAWAGVRRAACGFDHRYRQRHRGHEGISR